MGRYCSRREGKAVRELLGCSAIEKKEFCAEKKNCGEKEGLFRNYGF